MLDVCFKDEKSLLEGLKEMGYEPEVHENPAKLQGYMGDNRSQQCHIIIRRKQVGSASNDIGFERQKDGQYKIYISEYDVGAKRFDINKLKTIYAKRVAQEFFDNRSEYYVQSTETMEDGRIKMKVYVN
jgi:hypothetical protein